MFDDMIESFIAIGFVALILVFCFFLVKNDMVNEKKEREQFLVECLQDHKKYECDALWRAGKSDTEIVPMFIPIQMR